MLNFSPEKLLLVAIIALVVLGPSRLPQAARTLGRALAEVRKVSGSFQAEVRDAIAEPRDALSNAVGELGLRDLRTSVRDTVTGVVAPIQSGLNPLAPPATSPTPAPRPVPDDPALN